MMRIDRDPAPDVIETNMDKWDGAVSGRDRLFAAVEQSKVSGIVTLTGDIHTNWAGNLKKNFDDDTSPTLGVELVATSISSGGDGGDGRATMARHASINPHVKLFNNQRGYVRHIVRPDRWQADFRVVQKVSTQGSPIKTRQSLVTELTNPGIVPI
jgi:alkaline phosphatase D